MSAAVWPARVTFRDPTTKEQCDVRLPRTREEAKKIVAEIHRLAATDPSACRHMVRMYTACDLYILGLLSSAADRLDPYTGRPEIDCDFQFAQSREIQFDSDRVIDYSARGHWKSSWKIFLLAIQQILVDPNVSIAIMAHEMQAAERHLRRVKEELESNEILKIGWCPDVLWRNPREEASLWATASGLIVPGRKIVTLSPTIAAYTFVGKLPVGQRFSILKLDDCETAATVESDAVNEKVKRRFYDALNLLGRASRVEMNGTFHSANGLLAELLEKGWRGRCHKAEDTSKEPPDIARIFDELGGVDPATGTKLAPQVRSIKLQGAPPFWHPIECAIKRWEQGEANYCQQNMGESRSGMARTFQDDWFRYYEEAPHERADGKNLYVLLDPSRGLSDPSFCWVIAAEPDETFSIIDGFRKRLQPTDLDREMYLMVAKWMNIGQIVGIRVEEYGQSTYSVYLGETLKRHRLNVPDPIRCATTKTNKLMERVWQRLEPPFRQGKFFFPRQGIATEDEGHRVFELIDTWRLAELDKFPEAKFDDGLNALALLYESIEKVGPTLWTELAAPKSRYRHDADLDELDDYGQDAGSWMSAGFA